MKKSAFDCIKMKDEAQRRRAEKMDRLTDEERLEYYRQAHLDFVRRQESLRSRDRSADATDS